MIALGTPRELVASLGAEHVVEFALADGRRIDDAAARRLPGVRDVRRDAAQLHLSTSELHLTVPALLDFLRQRDADAEPARHAQRDARGRVRDADGKAVAR